jgi:hypothetical protein
MTVFRYCIGQHNLTTLYKSLVDHGAHGGIYGSEMLVVKGSKRIVDHKFYHVLIVAAQTLITAHKR